MNFFEYKKDQLYKRLINGSDDTQEILEENYYYEKLQASVGSVNSDKILTALYDKKDEIENKILLKFEQSIPSEEVVIFIDKYKEKLIKVRKAISEIKSYIEHGR